MKPEIVNNAIKKSIRDLKNMQSKMEDGRYIDLSHNSIVFRIASNNTPT